MEIPASHRNLLRQANGLTVGEVAIFGIPPSMLLDPPLLDRRKRQPLDLGTANRTWRLEFNGFQHAFHLGSQARSTDKNAGLFLAEDSKIVGVLKTGQVVQKWRGYDELLEYAIAEIAKRA